MKQKIILVLFIMFTYTMNLDAQNIEEWNSRASGIGVTLGGTNMAILDKSFSKLGFNGTVPKIGFLFLSNKKANYWNANLTINVGNVKDNNQYFESQYLKGKMGMVYGRQVQQTANQKRYLGGSLRSEVMLLIYNGFDSGSWMSNQVFDLYFANHFFLKEKHRIEIGLSYPILGFITRPPYSGVDKFVSDNVLTIPKIIYGRGKIKTGIHYINPILKLRYWKEWVRWRFVLELEDEFLSYKSAHQIQQNSFSVSLAILYKFGKNEN